MYTRHTPPTPEEERALHAQYLQGDVKAGHDLVLRHGALWNSMALWYYRRDGTTGAEHADFVSRAWEAALSGLDSFDPDKGRFTTYVGFWVRTAIRNALLADKRRRSKHPEYCIMEKMRRAVYSEPATEDAYCGAEAAGRLREAIKNLPEMERKVIELRWLTTKEPPLRDIAAIVGLSPERVRQIQVSAFARLREELKEEA